MSVAGPRPAPETLLTEAEVARRVDALAEAIAPRIDDDWVVVCLLVGGLWFAADLTRALARRGRSPLFDAVWPASYGDARESRGEVVLRAGLQRPVAGRGVLLVDEVIDSGASLAHVRDLVLAAGAREVLAAAFARKPWPAARAAEPEFVAWEAPARFLVGYGMDAAGRLRGWADIGALD